MTYSLNNTEHKATHAWSVSVALLLAFAILLQGMGLARTTPTGTPPDEWAHLSYIDDVASGGHLMPDYSTGVVHHTSQLNYLNHPFLYYSGLGIVSKLLHLSPQEKPRPLRYFNCFLVALGFFFWLLTARRLGVPLAVCIVLTLACCATPMFSYMAGSVNNDNLAYLGVAVFFYGVFMIKTGLANASALSVFWLAVGLLITFLTKATASAFLVFFIAFLALRYIRQLPELLSNRSLLAWGIIVVTVCASYYGWMLYSHGNLFPRPGNQYQAAKYVEPMSFLAYAWFFSQVMWDRLPDILAAGYIVVLENKSRVAFYVMVTTPVVGWLIARLARWRHDSPGDILRDGFIMAFLMTLLVHIFEMHHFYGIYGVFAGLQPRYYSYLLPGIWVVGLLEAQATFIRRAVETVFAIGAIGAFWGSVPLLASRQPLNSNAQFAAAPSPQRAVSQLDIVPAASGLGSVDEIAIDGTTLKVRGWALDPADYKPVEAVLISHGSRLVGVIAPHVSRDDVARALGRPESLLSGFTISINNMPANTQACEISVAEATSDGSLTALKAATCAPTVIRSNQK
jgi:hypothetical protein